MIGMVLCLVCFSFGIWQVERVDEKQQLAEQFRLQSGQAPISLNGRSNLKMLSEYQRVEVTGTYIPEAEVLLDNIVLNGKAGFHVLTPLKIQGRDSVVLIDRGWIPLGRDRSIIPDIDTPLARRSMTGILAMPRDKPMFIDSNNEAAWKKIVLFVDMEQIAEKLGYAVMPLTIRLNADAESGFARIWPLHDAKISMHVGYAIQWFIFSGFALLLTVYACFKKKPGESEPEPEADVHE